MIQDFGIMMCDEFTVFSFERGRRRTENPLDGVRTGRGQPRARGSRKSPYIGMKEEHKEDSLRGSGGQTLWW